MTSDLPVLNDAERQELEEIAGRKLSNDEAQMFRQEVLDAAAQDRIDRSNAKERFDYAIWTQEVRDRLRALRQRVLPHT